MSKYVVSNVLPVSFLGNINDDKNIFQFGKLKFFYDYEKVKTFKRSCTCINCGVKAVGLRIERMKGCNHNIYGKNHLNMYAITPNGFEVLMTVDHEVLKSKGGANTTENFNTMCELCNRLRGSKYENLQDFLDIYKDVSTEEYWENVQKTIEANKLRKRETNIRKIEESKTRIKQFYAEESMHHHVGLYNRHMKKLYKEQLTAQS